MVSVRGRLRRLKFELRHALDDQRLARFEHRAATLACVERRRSRALVLPASGVGSLGDEAMLLVSGQVLRECGIEDLTVISYGFGDSWSAVGEFDEVVHLGGQYQVEFWQACDRLLEAFATSTHLLIHGADVMDGYYDPSECFRRCALARIGTAAGLRVTIGGFSFNDNPHPRCVKALDRLPESIDIVARDPISSARLTSQIRRNVKSGADMAFLLRPAELRPSLQAYATWLDRQRSMERTMIAVNANYLAIGEEQGGNGLDGLVRAFVDGLMPLVSGPEKLSIMLVPHDYRPMAGRFDDMMILEAIASGFPPQLAEFVALVSEPIDAAEAKALVGGVDVVLSGRMHLAIAALSQGVPAAGIMYQGKFEGLYQMLQLDGMLLHIEALFDDQLSSFVRDLIHRRRELKRVLAGRLPLVRELAQFSFANLRDSEP